ncbi:hypothetical protein [Xanthomonas maliensis]|uniref:hypothetical protein n=1 Tax=Xanthomonas maliensis TaxID=1321368 RepID=UPI00039D854B|nr:hypothetical protein [Xanthomonas maliensis]
MLAAWRTVWARWLGDGRVAVEVNLEPLFAEGPEGSYLCSVFFVAAIAWIQWRTTRGAQNFSQTSR